MFSLISEIKGNWIRFTRVSLFHYKISLLFFLFFSLIFASNFLLRYALVIFASKQNEAKQNSSLFFCFFRLFLFFFTFFRFFFAFFPFFRFTFFASLRFSNFRFEAKRGGKLFRFKRSKIQYFSHYFASQFRFG